MAGFAIPGAEIRIVDHDGADVPCDGKSVGHVVARGDGIMHGYWRQPEETAHVFRVVGSTPATSPPSTKTSYLLIVDREKDIIVSGGENISSLELEKTLGTHPSVYEAAVVAVPHEKWGEVPKACVVLKPGQPSPKSELIELCRSCLARYKCPHYIEFHDALPKTGTGKILKRELRKDARPVSQ